MPSEEYLSELERLYYVVMGHFPRERNEVTQLEKRVEQQLANGSLRESDYRGILTSIKRTIEEAI